MGITIHPSLETFMKVAQMGSIHGAAREMGLTQTAVTKRVRALEKQISTTLFLRSRRGMGLTEAGLAFLQHCRSVEELEGALISRLSGERRAEISLTIVGPTSAISSRIASDCESLYEQHPHLRLHLRSDDHSDLIDQIRRGRADLAIVSPEFVPNEMQSKVLRPDRYVLVGSAKWKGRRLQDILEQERIIDFDEGDMTTRRYLKKFNLLPKALRDRLFVNENDALIRFFSGGIGYGTLTESIAQPYLDRNEIILLNRGQVLEDPLAVAWYPRSQKSQDFIDLIKALK